MTAEVVADGALEGADRGVRDVADGDQAEPVEQLAWSSPPRRTARRRRAGGGAWSPPTAGTTNTPSGLARRLASLATVTDAATPTEQVMPCSSWIVARSCSAISTGEPSRRVEPRTSRNASSSESTSTSGVTRRKFSITDDETVANVSKSGGTTSASGHSRRARVIGIPERTPYARAR